MAFAPLTAGTWPRGHEVHPKWLQRRGSLPARARSPQSLRAPAVHRGFAGTTPARGASRGFSRRHPRRAGSQPDRGEPRWWFVSTRPRRRDRKRVFPLHATARNRGSAGRDRQRENAAIHSRRARSGASSGPRTGRRRADLLRADRRNEALAALGAPPLQNEAAGLRAHPGTKTMGPLSANAARLKSTLHEALPARLGIRGKRRGKLPTRARRCQGERRFSFANARDTFW